MLLRLSFWTSNKEAKYILETDVAKCFDQIDHNALCEKLNASPSFTRQIRAWLKAGVMDGDLFQATPTGAAQGSVISPLLANVALHGVEKAHVERRFGAHAAQR